MSPQFQKPLFLNIKFRGIHFSSVIKTENNTLNDLKEGSLGNKTHHENIGKLIVHAKVFPRSF